MPPLPFVPKRRKFLPLLCGALSAALIGMLIFATWLSPPKASDFWPFTSIWAMVGALVFALWIIAREKLTFREDGFERISGLRRQFIAYDSIARLEWKRQPGRCGPAQFLEVGFKKRVPVIQIWRDNYEVGELEKIAEVLRAQAPNAHFERH